MKSKTLSQSILDTLRPIPQSQEDGIEPQFVDNQIEKHICKEEMTLTRTRPDQSVTNRRYKLQAFQHKNLQQLSTNDTGTYIRRKHLLCKRLSPVCSESNTRNNICGRLRLFRKQSLPSSRCTIRVTKAFQPEMRRPPCIGKRALTLKQLTSLEVSEKGPQVKVIIYLLLSHYSDPDISIAFNDADISDIETSTSDPKFSLEFYFS